MIIPLRHRQLKASGCDCYVSDDHCYVFNERLLRMMLTPNPNWMLLLCVMTWDARIRCSNEMLYFALLYCSIAHCMNIYIHNAYGVVAVAARLSLYTASVPTVWYSYGTQWHTWHVRMDQTITIIEVHSYSTCMPSHLKLYTVETELS
jgi:hypothetical protein